jgi:outer membrane assembly lipoprotein YfiO
MRQQRRRRRTGVLFAAASGLGLLAGVVLTPAAAQQRYELSDERWQVVEPPDPDSPKGRLQAIRKQLAEGEAKDAEKAATTWIETYPEHPLAVEAYLLRGDARAAQNNLYKALFDYEYLIRRYPASEQFHTALRREYEIARLYVNGKNRDFLGLPILPADGDGAEILIRIQERAPGSAIGEEAHLLLGDYYFNDGQMSSAAEAYSLFLENYPDSPNREFAMLRTVQASLARYKGPRYDQRGLIEAQQRLKLYAAEFPASAEQIGANALTVRIRESLAQRDLITARWYVQRGEDVSAALLLRRVITDYPDTAAAGEAVDELEALGQPVVIAPAEDARDAEQASEQEAEAAS